MRRRPSAQDRCLGDHPPAPDAAPHAAPRQAAPRRPVRRQRAPRPAHAGDRPAGRPGASLISAASAGSPRVADPGGRAGCSSSCLRRLASLGAWACRTRRPPGNRDCSASPTSPPTPRRSTSPIAPVPADVRPVTDPGDDLATGARATATSARSPSSPPGSYAVSLRSGGQRPAPLPRCCPQRVVVPPGGAGTVALTGLFADLALRDAARGPLATARPARPGCGCSRRPPVRIDSTSRAPAARCSRPGCPSARPGDPVVRPGRPGGAAGRRRARGRRRLPRTWPPAPSPRSSSSTDPTAG